MTRAEAIECLKYQNDIKFGGQSEALKMAIQALEQEPTTKNDLGVDCISRADAIKAMQNKAKKLKNEDTINGLCGAVAILYEMPPITPQEPKIGHWIPLGNYDEWGNENSYKCSECGDRDTYPDNYCHNCGAKMIEPKEKRCEDCDHYGKLSLDCGRCDDDCSMFESKESEE